ncbi:hypothetical protein D3C71_1556870 [compost metagenome]
MLRIQMNHGKDLMGKGPEPGPQEVLDHRRRRQHVGTTHPARQHPLRRSQHLIGLGRPVRARDIANQQGRRRSRSEGIEGREQIVRHGELQ